MKEQKTEKGQSQRNKRTLKATQPYPGGKKKHLSCEVAGGGKRGLCSDLCKGVSLKKIQHSPKQFASKRGGLVGLQGISENFKAFRGKK